jgi:CRISPR system Cascade subunit CasD
MLALQGAKIDGFPSELPIPTRSMITGIFGAALGLSRGEVDQLQAIQDHLRIAVAVHRRGVGIMDYQTADLGKPYLKGPMWSSGISVMEREGLEKEGTRIQQRPYTCDADMTVLVELLDGAPFTASALLSSLDEPQRVLAFGRMSCPPSGRIAGEMLAATTLEQAIADLQGDIYLPVEATTPTLGDLFVSIPGTRRWRDRRHGGVDVFVQRSAKL